MDSQILNQLQEQIRNKKTDVIFFDLFDTLVSRKTHPEDVKKICAKRLVDYYGLPTTVNDCYLLRASFERLLCEKNQSEGFDLEFNIRALANHMYYEFVNMNVFANNETLLDFTNCFVEIELSVEKSVQFVNKDMFDLLKLIDTLKQSVNKNLSCYVISDFYLPSKELLEILKHHGLAQYFDNIYSSSDCLLTKRSGKLYDKIIVQLNLSADKVTMIGDNRHSDYDMAIQRGFSAYHIDRSQQFSLYKNYQKQAQNAEQTITKDISFLKNKNLLFPEFSLDLYAFFEKLLSKLHQNNSRDVFFLAREGLPLKDLFAIYQDTLCLQGKQRINSHYFYTSRRSTMLPSLKTLEQENFEILFRQYVNISIEEFLQSLGFNSTEITDINSSLNQDLSLDISKRINDLPRSEAFAMLCKNHQFKQYYEDNRLLQRKTFLEYVQSFNVELSSDKPMILVDVGWKGTIQDNINKIMSDICPVVGYYVGLAAMLNQNESNQKTGLLFEIAPKETPDMPSFGYRILNENKSLFEILLAANHGSVLCYQKNNDNQHSNFVVLDEFTESQQYKEKIESELQQTFTLFTKLCEIMTKHYYEHNQMFNIVLKNHARMVLSPTCAEMNWFSDIYHIENFGVFEKSQINIHHVNLSSRLKTFLELFKDHRYFIGNQMWPRAAFYYNGIPFLGAVYSYRIMKQYNIG